MPVIRAAEAPTFTLPGVRFVGLTAPSRGASELCTWHLYVEPQTSGGNPHRLDHEEVFVVLEGTLQAIIDGEEVTCVAGDALAVPANEPAPGSTLLPGAGSVQVRRNVGLAL